MAAVSLCVVFFLCIYLDSIQKNRRRLLSPADKLPIAGKMVSPDGGRDWDLNIAPDRVKAILNSPYPWDVVISVPFSFRLGLEPLPGPLQVPESGALTLAGARWGGCLRGLWAGNSRPCCPVCCREVDPFIRWGREPTEQNHGVTLAEARENDQRHGACSPRVKPHCGAQNRGNLPVGI